MNSTQAVTAPSHDPYQCDPACCETHEQAVCAMCGEDRGPDYVVSYLLGCETDDDDRWGRFREAGRWVTFCGPCDDAWMRREYPL